MNLHLHPLLLCLSSMKQLLFVPCHVFYLWTCAHVCVFICLCLFACACLGRCVCVDLCLPLYLHSPPTLVIMNNPTLFGGSRDNVVPRWACMVLSRARLAPVSCEGWGEAANVLDSTGHPGPAVNHSWQPESSHREVQTSQGSYLGTGICHLWSRWWVISSPVINFPPS